MGQFKRWFKKAWPFIAATITTAGVTATSVLAFRSGKKMQEAGEVDNKEKAKILAPPIASGLATTAFIFSNAAVTKHQQTKLAAAVTLANTGYLKLKEKIEEELGKEKAHEIENQIVREEAVERAIKKTGNKNLYYCEYFDGGYFEATEEELYDAWVKVIKDAAINSFIDIETMARHFGVNAAENYKNYEFVVACCDIWDDPTECLLDNRAISLGDFYFALDPVELEDGLTCNVLRFSYEPKPYED